MEKKIHTYKGTGITVTYDVKRCIHAAECVRKLPEVFDTSRRAWVQPDNASPEDVAEIIERCPTGALQYEMNIDSKTGEVPPVSNKIMIRPNGPLYFYGDLELQDAQGNVLLTDTRVAICRCGASSNKPLCDNSHQSVRFRADTNANVDRDKETTNNEGGKLIVQFQKNGPTLVKGNYTLTSSAMESYSSNKTIAFCRCGGSGNKPFCDGTHRKNEFRDS